jgi:FMN-dependent NADH-azoreductase
MPNLLHLDTSARFRSFSRSLGARFADRWRQRHPDGGYHYRDLTAEPGIPAETGPAATYPTATYPTATSPTATTPTATTPAATTPAAS